MLLNRATAERIAAGSLDCVYRRWESVRIKPGSTLRTVAGVVAIDSIEEVPSVPPGADLPPGGSGTLYRIAVHWVGPDEREDLSATVPGAAERSEILDRLDALDRSRRTGPWTRQVLDLIARHPGVSARILAERLGRERLAFKRDVRRLKELGLTHSLEVGYELSPRGRAIHDPDD